MLKSQLKQEAYAHRLEENHPMILDVQSTLLEYLGLNPTLDCILSFVMILKRW
jgi:hypothetical protein